MLNFLLKSLSQKPLCFEAKLLTVSVLCFDLHCYRSFYFPKVARYG